MDHSVQDENTHFHGQRVRKSARIAPRRFWRDSDVSHILRAFRWPGALRRKGKYIGGTAFLPIRLIQPRHGVIADQLDSHRIGWEAEFPPDALVEMLQRLDGHGNSALAVDNHRSPDNLDGRARFAVLGRSQPPSLVASELLIGPDNLLHEIVPDDVAFIEIDERNPFNPADDFKRLDQAGTPPGGQVNLRDVSGNDGLGVESQARKEHLHLFAGRVLSLVQNHE
jgi:hypothetical protein